ncbi:bifunctional 4-hydroxy-2-oxoglutarate aldolase/2-dehydro-3-deoxy-phosphogluconate aldolase [Agromyces sp. SYSU K20354]|uniref:bifunctional 4-hydroxy-2-oxoglutarate aldolase/2-dehydro-3-deoxy-phosphogluconate aldolase n=1 Tax=Agromyces cavernae TaxID=2898659 RepID=UPI001E4CEF64|nr:bifunctional 4-hydroxy-2-oxoglutarate aldolase/2-dehydro-3-deoxy-phosphogluconate aldolase [Agromyces cavernae]MCD2443416.1 bifunctional 4-hydroxy-2-oxoglutarate aldolase/2-dehydro-3-deoxy-phosphogluconate aldolase [Agromyces cavernae]
MILVGQRFVPVIVLDDARQAAPLAEALLRGGIGCAEITLRTDAGLAAIAAASTIPDFIVGAGTVLTPDDVDRVVDAGARFVVSPGLAEDVVERSIAVGVEVIPGVATATEMQRALRLGLSRLKLFPAGPLGGVATMNALAGPFPDVRFLPSGGVTADNAGEYLASPSVFAVSGSWMATRELIAAGDFDAIERLSRACVALEAS